MSECPMVLTVYFGKFPQSLNFRDFDADRFLGLTLWKPNGKAIYRWAIDYVSCSDERWTIFGPYDDVVSARAAFDSIPEEMRPHLRGYRVEPQHCRKTGSLPSQMWTDG